MNDKNVDFVNEYHFYRHIFQKVKFNTIIDGVKREGTPHWVLVLSPKRKLSIWSLNLMVNSIIRKFTYESGDKHIRWYLFDIINNNSMESLIRAGSSLFHNEIYNLSATKIEESVYNTVFEAWKEGKTIYFEVTGAIRMSDFFDEIEVLEEIKVAKLEYGFKGGELNG